jgi:hypothetical protein
MSETDTIEHFARVARGFCTFWESANTLPLHARMQKAQGHLADVYAAALLLPERSGHGDNPPSIPPQFVAPFTGEERDIYWMVEDPYAVGDTGTVAGSLADDLGDIYVELRRGLGHFDAGAVDAAVWSWRFSFDAHWGSHAVGALGALHHALRLPMRS